MKELREALKAALKNKSLVARAAKGAAESMVHGMAYQEASKLREEMEESSSEAKAEGDKPRAADNSGNIVRVSSRTIAPARTASSPASLAAGKLGRK